MLGGTAGKRGFFNAPENYRAGWDSYYMDPSRRNQNLASFLANYYDTSQAAYKVRSPDDDKLEWMDWLDLQKEEGAYDPLQAFARLAPRQRGEDPNRFAPPVVYRSRY